MKKFAFCIRNIKKTKETEMKASGGKKENGVDLCRFNK